MTYSYTANEGWDTDWNLFRHGIFMVSESKVWDLFMGYLSVIDQFFHCRLRRFVIEKMLIFFGVCVISETCRKKSIFIILREIISFGFLFSCLSRVLNKEDTGNFTLYLRSVFLKNRTINNYVCHCVKLSTTKNNCY